MEWIGGNYRVVIAFYHTVQHLIMLETVIDHAASIFTSTKGTIRSGARAGGHKRSRSIVVTGTWSSVYFARKSFASDSITSGAARCGFAFRGFSMSRESSGAHRFGLVLARPCPSVTVSNRRNEATSRGKIVATPRLESRPSPTLAESFSINWSMWNCYILFVFMFPCCLKYCASI